MMAFQWGYGFEIILSEMFAEVPFQQSTEFAVLPSFFAVLADTSLFSARWPPGHSSSSASSRWRRGLPPSLFQVPPGPLLHRLLLLVFVCFERMLRPVLSESEDGDLQLRGWGKTYPVTRCVLTGVRYTVDVTSGALHSARPTHSFRLVGATPHNLE
jgi:hypothetical protein